MREVTIIADDLTGAADCGIAFTLAGIETFVATRGKPPSSARVVAVDTGSRGLPAAEAARRTAAAADARSVLYKKIDSTLRGNAGPEIAAIAQGAFVVAAPAFPALGRTTRDGEVFVQGVRLSGTQLWRSSGMRGPSTLAEMLRAEGLRTLVVPLARIRESATRAIEAAAEAASAAVCDAETDDDLALIARAGAQLGKRVVWVGSSGLARQLPKALALPAGPPPRLPPRRKGPILTLVGSRAGASREQAAALASVPGVFSLAIPPGELLTRTHRGDELDRALGERRDCVVAIAAAGEADDGAEREGGDDPRNGADERGGGLDLPKAVELAQALGDFAAPHTVRCAGVIATGGDTARALLASLDLSGIALLGEIEAGVPFGLAGSLLLATKAGAFGSGETLLRASSALHRMTD